MLAGLVGLGDREWASQIPQTIGPASRTERATRMRRTGSHSHIAGGLLRLGPSSSTVIPSSAPSVAKRRLW
jgi:hypothetical protein